MIVLYWYNIPYVLEKMIVLYWYNIPYILEKMTSYIIRNPSCAENFVCYTRKNWAAYIIQRGIARKICSEKLENLFGKIGKFVWKIWKKLLTIYNRYIIMDITTNKHHMEDAQLTKEQLKELGYNEIEIELIMEIIEEGKR